MTEKEFVSYIGPLAATDMKKTGILASVTAAQAILESGYGSTELAVAANNLFGMKATLSGNNWPSEWDGQTYTKDTKEQDKGGNEYTVSAAFRKYASHAASIKDHSDYLAGAKNGSALRYAGLIGETDYKTAAALIKGGGYATDINYVSKLCNIIEKWNLTKYDEAPQKRSEGTLNIIESIVTNSDCYKTGRTITVKGLMLHSVGCPQPKATVFVNNWNKPGAGACVHAVIDAEGSVYQLLPWNRRGWHCASGQKGSGNNTHIGVEMTEPATIRYTSGANWKETGDGTNTRAHVMATYKTAVELFAYLCKKYSLNPTADGVIISHHEGNVRGIASNHGDVEHIWNKFGLTMDQFRRDVKAAMSGTGTSPATQTRELYRVRKTWADAKSQIGAFSVLENAKAVCKEGYTVFNSKGQAVFSNEVEAQKKPNVNLPYKVKVDISDLRIRKGPGTNYGSAGYTGEGVFTIVKEKDGPGATKWGLLKSYEGQENGWISLDYATKIA
ncbi:glucosaminidase domain-containing protein [[Clostridium] scindens]|uniref:glucosaminidase domain-containing protein n=1 Tax=Clostridium scindens (strain JCM 10418 / VPI 12708) TaxID=29347 RepID=UPI002ED67E3A